MHDDYCESVKSSRLKITTEFNAMVDKSSS